MKTIKTYIQVRRNEFFNNGGGIGFLGGGGWLLELLFGGVGVGVGLVLLISLAVKAIKSLLANKLIFCMRVFFDGGGTMLSSDVSRSPDF